MRRSRQQKSIIRHVGELADDLLDVIPGLLEGNDRIFDCPDLVDNLTKVESGLALAAHARVGSVIPLCSIFWASLR